MSDKLKGVWVDGGVWEHKPFTHPLANVQNKSYIAELAFTMCMGVTKVLNIEPLINV